MAVWQYWTYAVPRGLLAEALGNGIGSKSVGEVLGLIDEFSWSKERDIMAAIQLADARLSRTQGWNKLALYWGSEDGDDLVISKSGSSADIRLRFDLRCHDGLFAKFAVDLIKCIDGVLIGGDDQLIMTAEELDEALNSSDACAFVRDPMQYLDTLKSRSDLG